MDVTITVILLKMCFILQDHGRHPKGTQKVHKKGAVFGQMVHLHEKRQ